MQSRICVFCALQCCLNPVVALMDRIKVPLLKGCLLFLRCGGRVAVDAPLIHLEMFVFMDILLDCFQFVLRCLERIERALQ